MMDLQRKLALAALLLIAVASSVPLAAAKRPSEFTFTSPNRENAIIVRVLLEQPLAEMGRFDREGVVWLRTKGGCEYRLLKEFFTYEPDVKWLSNDLAEMFIGCGSPHFYKRYIRAGTRTVSRGYDFAVAISPDLKYLVTVDFENIGAYRVFGEKPVKTYVWLGLSPLTVAIAVKVRFISLHRFSVAYEWPRGKKQYREFEI